MRKFVRADSNTSIAGSSVVCGSEADDDPAATVRTVLLGKLSFEDSMQEVTRRQRQLLEDMETLKECLIKSESEKEVSSVKAMVEMPDGVPQLNRTWLRWLARSGKDSLCRVLEYTTPDDASEDSLVQNVECSFCGKRCRNARGFAIHIERWCKNHAMNQEQDVRQLDRRAPSVQAV